MTSTDATPHLSLVDAPPARAEQPVRTEQVYQVVIRTTPQQVWDAITRPEFTAQYFHGARITVVPDGYASRGPEGEVWGDEQVLEFDPPHRLVHTWRSLYDPELAAEPASRVTWQVDDQEDGTVLLTVVHDRLDASPGTARSVSGLGWTSVVSGLKTLLETGTPMLG